MPSGPFLYAEDFIDVLKKKHAAASYKEMVEERTSNHHTYERGSHVMQYGDIPVSKKPLSLYLGFDPANANATLENSLTQHLKDKDTTAINQRDADLLYLWQKVRKQEKKLILWQMTGPYCPYAILFNLFYNTQCLWQIALNVYKRSKADTPEKLEAEKELVETMTHRLHLDRSIKLIGKLLFGSEMGPSVLNAIRSYGHPLVDDWDCLKTMVRTFETHCGSLSQYGMKHMRALANICNKGVSVDSMAEVSAEACPQIPSAKLSSLQGGYSA
ncbi:hypothetical protein KI387_010650, partial [Taxus chinensis]